ncbi:MAG: competence/damage-inducible protein A, partial [Calditrichaeota bacterium]|nr:competence/damage-inducible protein A [Calditrichota bacterium]
MNASIISIGTELLSGRTVNTNSTEISKLLYLNDIDIIRSLSIHDTSADIKKALDYCLADSDLCILTGGLGPTNDDITKLSLCNYFDDELVLNETELDRLEQWFRKRNRVMSDVNRQQAYYPSKSRQFINDLGTASGILFEETDKIVISLPGVPHEMIHLMNNRVMPYLREKNPQRKDHHSLIFRLVNKAESDVFKILEDMIEHNKQISFAFYPNFMLLDLILSGPQKQLDQVATEVLERIGD